MEILITVTSDGQLRVEVKGQQNKALIVGVLEIAKATFLSPPKTEGASPILIAQGSLPKNGALALR